MSEEIRDIRERLIANGERLARIEERTDTAVSMLRESLEGQEALAGRVSSLEGLRGQVVVVAGMIGAGISLAWDFIKTRIMGGN